MVTNSVRKIETIEFDENYKQKSYNKRKHVSKKSLNMKNKSRHKIYIICILLTSLLTSYYTYVNIHCKDLSYSIEYNLTKGFPSNKRLFRVNSISVIESKGSTEIVKVSGLSKKAPHKTISIIANFQKENDIWVLKHIY